MSIPCANPEHTLVTIDCKSQAEWLDMCKRMDTLRLRYDAFVSEESEC